MNKGDLVEAVAAELNESKAQAARVVDAVLESISQGVQKDGKVSIIGFGSFDDPAAFRDIRVQPLR